jgi:hypothetical protein
LCDIEQGEAVSASKVPDGLAAKKRVATGCLLKPGPKRKSAFFSNVFAKLIKYNNLPLPNNEASLK